MEDLIQLVGNLGFPIAVAVYLLVVMRKSNDMIYNVLIEVKTLLQDWRQTK